MTIETLIREANSQTLKSPPANLAPSSTTTPRAPASRGSRTPRTPRRIELQTTRLEAVGDDLGPLGPLGDKAIPEPAPEPPLKEQTLPQRRRPQPSTTTSAGSQADFLGDADLQGAKPRFPPPVQPPTGAENAKRQGQPSVSVEQAAKPSFDITVGDPHKVGDLTSSHIVYQVRTKVGERRLPCRRAQLSIRTDQFQSLQTA